MFPSKKLTTAVALFIGLSIFIPVAQAQQSIDITDSVFAKITMLSESKELAIMSSEVWGMVTSNNENKIFEDLTSHCVAVRKFVAGKQMKSLTYTKFMDSDGDFFIVETIRDGSETGPEGKWAFLEGTGKWKGIKGGGKGWFTARGKVITPGTFHGRVRMTGIYELPKK
jgi:hypothetical protein